MHFIGIDLAWKTEPEEQSTGMCAIDPQGDVNTDLLTTDEEIIAYVRSHLPAWVGIDASLHVPDHGQRSAERILRARGVPILPTNRGFYERHYGGCRGVELAHRLQEIRMEDFDTTAASAFFEVYPRAAIRLIDEQALGYKHGPKSSRLNAMGRLLQSLSEREPSLRLPAGHQLRTWSMEKDVKGATDRLDALICAVCVYEHRLYCGHRSEVIGDKNDGYILLPRRH